MQKLSLGDLYPLETYARLRPEFRARVMEHKAHRKLPLGEHVTLLFEDRLTMHYQVQEMLRAERLFEEADIAAELDAYNPLIPDGSNWKATMLIEYPDPEQRREALARLTGIEHRVWMQVEGFEPVHAIADEDLERSTEDKTSAVHFLRFELAPEMIAALRNGAGLHAGISHPAYEVSVQVPELTRESLLADLD
ncbi:MAG: DUF3501 family protein [Gammaproteobacteria bacterium]|nr:MAG: DUF3501 family protein [Gammaproteobacteria bacterium]